MIPKAEPLGVKTRRTLNRGSALWNSNRQSASSRSLALQIESISISIALGRSIVSILQARIDGPRLTGLAALASAAESLAPAESGRAREDEHLGAVLG